MISGCEVFHKPSLYNISIRDQIVLPPLQHSITPILHKPFKFKETQSPLGIAKAGSFGLGFLRMKVVLRRSTKIEIFPRVRDMNTNGNLIKVKEAVSS